MAPTCQRQVHGGTCGAPLHRVALNSREWGWADETGSMFGDRFPFNAYEELNRLAKIPERAADYALLKVLVDLGGTFHQHDPGSTRPAHVGPVPEHCDYPAYLSPSGWECRRCLAPLPADLPPL